MRAVLILFAVLGAWSSAVAQERQVCDVRVDITDTDPAGTNVRDRPGGRIIASLNNPGDGWIAVHVTAQSGDWYEIDRAMLMDADQPPQGKTLFHARGYLHKSMLGLSGMQNGGAIHADHDTASRLVVAHAAGDQNIALLGCWGGFLKVRVRHVTGWTREACTNMNTTCA